jgi:glycosyltransferase involved in cell wall biosynthesis
MKVVIISHGHPELSPGGAERAAYSLFEHLKSKKSIEPTFIARAEPRDIGHDGWFGAFRAKKDEFLWSPPPFEWFRCVSLQSDALRQQVKTIAERFRPDVVHFHHYFFFGLDALAQFKSEANCGVALTLHEYGLICTHNGQMVKKPSLRLCYAASSAECATCFPEVSSGKFFLRERLIKQMIGDLDVMVSPSQFLRDRYVDWGLDPRRIEVVENLLPPAFGAAAAQGNSVPGRSVAKAARVRFGYFGQLTPYKGANVLIDTLKHLSAESLERVEIVIFGARLDQQPPEFRELLEKQMIESVAKVSFFGPYRNDDVQSLLRSVDWMVIPSIWWENSPLVIQEARAMGTPILASNIGGMAEKVRDGVDGLHFLAGSAMDCASKMESIVSGRINIKPVAVDVRAQNERSLDQHMRIYNSAKRV